MAITGFMTETVDLRGEKEVMAGPRLADATTDVPATVGTTGIAATGAVVGSG